MLNTSLLSEKLETLGLSQSDIATKCDVSREAVSNWFKQESMPRPSKLRMLSDILGLKISELYSQPETKITYAYRTKQNRPLTPAAKEFADTLAMRLEESACFFPPTLRSFSTLEEPKLTDDYIEQVTLGLRKQLGLNHIEPLTKGNLFDLIRTFGAHFVPVIWGDEKRGHENALTVLIANPQNYFVILNLNVKEEDVKYWLAHEYGHCLSLHKLTDEDGEQFSEKFAQELLFPNAFVSTIKEDFLKSTNKISFIFQLSERYGIAPYHVFKKLESTFDSEGKKMGITSQSIYMAMSRRTPAPSTFLETYSQESPVNASVYLGVAEELGSSLPSALAKAYSKDSLNIKNLAEMLGISVSDSMAIISSIHLKESKKY